MEEVSTAPQDFLNEMVAQAPLIFAWGYALGRKIDSLRSAMAKTDLQLAKRVHAIEKRLGIELDEDDTTGAHDDGG